MTTLAGVYAPISTPFSMDEDVDMGGLRENLARYAESGIHGYLALGSNGENRSLTEAERLAVLRTIVQHRGDGQVVMAGATYDAQREAERFLVAASDIGADYGLVLAPGYFRKQMTTEVLVPLLRDARRRESHPLAPLQRPGLQRHQPDGRTRSPTRRALQHRGDEGQRTLRHRRLPRAATS